MSRALVELLKQQAPAKCDACKGGGVVTVQDKWVWMPEPRWCGVCHGSGRTPQPQEKP